jgi:uncharacterized protein YndB with AHSA1/START domain
MHPIWEQRKHRYHTVVEPQDALFILEREFALPPALLWEYLTKPKYRSILFGADKQELAEIKQGRVGDGSVYVCSHGKNMIQQSVVDWHPFEQYTIRQGLPGGGFLSTTICLKEAANGTTASVLAGKTEEGPSMIRGLLNIVGRKIGTSTFEEGFDALSKIIEAETADNNLIHSTAVEIPIDQIEDALTESLSQVESPASAA